jgi:hypothetical protein
MGRYSSLAAAALAAAMLNAAPAVAADDMRAQSFVVHRAAVVGGVVRLDLGARSRSAPEARMGIGMTQYQRDGTGALVSLDGPRMPVTAGLAGGRLQLFVGGETLPELERRMRLTGGSAPLLILGGVAVGVLAVVLLTGDDDEADGPCPPGVEVCAF